MIPSIASRSYRLIEKEGVMEFLRTAEDFALNRIPRLSRAPVVDEVCFRYSLDRLRRRRRSETDLDDVLDTAYRYSGAGAYGTIAPLQLRSELAMVTEYIDDLEPQTVVEIGTMYGGTFYTWARHLDSVETLVSVDVPGGTTPPRFLRRAAPEKRLEFVRGDSHATATREQVSEVLNGDDVDVLFVDGDHSLEGVREDWEMYRGLLADDGVVLFHDIVSIEEDEWTDVDLFWDQLKTNHEVVELVDPDYDPHDSIEVNGHPIVGHGFGLVLDPRD